MAQRPIGDRVRDVIHEKVPPGCNTGVYHILVGNLPFETTWQMFKDHLRAAAEIEHVELFMSSTTGWIRVFGEDNYNRVLAFLNTVPFKDRAIMADGRNATQEIWIRHLRKVDGLSKKHKSQISPHQRGAQTLSNQMPVAPPVVGSSHYGGSRDGCIYSPVSYDFEAMGTTGYDEAQGCDPFAWSAPSSMYDPSGCVEAHADPFLALHPSHHTTTSYAQPYNRGASLAFEDQFSDYVDPGSAGNAAAPADGRKIIIKEIAYRAREDQIRAMVRDVAGADRDQIESVTVPKYKNGSLKLIAYVLFATPHAAEAGLRRLHGRDFMGRKLVARLYTSREAATGPASGNNCSYGHGEPTVARSKVKGKDKDKDKEKDRKSNGKTLK